MVGGQLRSIGPQAYLKSKHGNAARLAAGKLRPASLNRSLTKPAVLAAYR